MTRKKKIIVVCSFLVCLSILAIQVNAYDVTEVDYIWDYLEKDTFFTDALRGLGWFIYVTIGTFLNLCYDAFTSVVKFDILKIPIVDTVIKNLDTLTPYILTIMIGVVLIIRLFDIKNIGKVFINAFVVTMLMATFSHILVLINDVKTVGIAETANVIGVEGYRISDALLAENTIDLKKSLDNGSVQYLDKSSVSEFRHDLRLDKDYLDEDIIDKNEDGTYNTESLSDGLWGFGEVHFYRYKTDYWALNVTMIVSIIIYIMATFKMGYLLSQWMQENIFGGLLMIKGVWDVHSVGKIFKSILSTVFAIIEVYFMMLLFSYFCANIMSSTEIANWMGKAILIYAMGMMIIAGSGFINDSLGIDDGSNFILRNLIVGRKLSQAGKAPFKAVSKVAAAGIIGGKAVGLGVKEMGNYFNSRYAGLLSDISKMDASGSLPNVRNSNVAGYDKNGNEVIHQPPQSRENIAPTGNADSYKGYNPDCSNGFNHPNGTGAPSGNGDPNTKEGSVTDTFTNSQNDSFSELKDKYDESLYQQDKFNVESSPQSVGSMRNHGSIYKTSNTVSNNPEHVQRMNDIASGKIGKVDEPKEREHRYPTADELADIVNSLNEWDLQKGGDDNGNDSKKGKNK